jgi:hypothetical protein
MWVIFRDSKSSFEHLDKYVVDMVADEDIAAYQQHLLKMHGGNAQEFHRDVYFLQAFLRTEKDVDYFIRKYRPWVIPPRGGTPLLTGSPGPHTLKAW